MLFCHAWSRFRGDRSLILLWLSWWMDLRAAVGWAARERDYFCMHLLSLKNMIQQLSSSVSEHVLH